MARRKLVLTGEVQSYSAGADPLAAVGWDVVSDRFERLRFLLEAYWGERVRVTIEVLPEPRPGRPPVEQ